MQRMVVCVRCICLLYKAMTVPTPKVGMRGSVRHSFSERARYRPVRTPIVDRTRAHAQHTEHRAQSTEHRAQRTEHSEHVCFQPDSRYTTRVSVQSSSQPRRRERPDPRIRSPDHRVGCIPRDMDPLAFVINSDARRDPAGLSFEEVVDRRRVRVDPHDPGIGHVLDGVVARHGHLGSAPPRVSVISEGSRGAVARLSRADAGARGARGARARAPRRRCEDRPRRRSHRPLDHPRQRSRSKSRRPSFRGAHGRRQRRWDVSRGRPRGGRPQ